MKGKNILFVFLAVCAAFFYPATLEAACKQITDWDESDKRFFSSLERQTISISNEPEYKPFSEVPLTLFYIDALSGALSTAPDDMGDE
jgi:hypothetical protein